MLDRKLEERIRRAKDLGISCVKTYSNGSLLTAERAKSLLESNLDELFLSFDGASREEYEKSRVPLLFDQVLENIHTRVRLRNEYHARGGNRMRIKVSCCSTEDKTGTMKLLQKEVDEFSFTKLHNWGTEDYTANRHRIRKPCQRPWKTVTILSNGDVVPCCLDYDGKIRFGNLHETTLQAIYHGEVLRNLQRLHKIGRHDEISICENCTKSFLV